MSKLYYPTPLTSIKVRPVVVLIPEELLLKIDYVLCLFISSSIPDELLETDFILERTHSSFSQIGLKYRFVFRAHKLALLHKSHVIRVLGELDDDLMKEINVRLKIVLGIDN